MQIVRQRGTVSLSLILVQDRRYRPCWGRFRSLVSVHGICHQARQVERLRLRPEGFRTSWSRCLNRAQRIPDQPCSRLVLADMSGFHWLRTKSCHGFGRCRTSSGTCCASCARPVIAPSQCAIRFGPATNGRTGPTVSEPAALHSPNGSGCPG